MFGLVLDEWHCRVNVLYCLVSSKSCEISLFAIVGSLIANTSVLIYHTSSILLTVGCVQNGWVGLGHRMCAGQDE